MILKTTPPIIFLAPPLQTTEEIRDRRYRLLPIFPLLRLPLHLPPPLLLHNLHKMVSLLPSYERQDSNIVIINKWADSMMDADFLTLQEEVLEALTEPALEPDLSADTPPGEPIPVRETASVHSASASAEGLRRRMRLRLQDSLDAARSRRQGTPSTQIVTDNNKEPEGRFLRFCRRAQIPIMAAMMLTMLFCAILHGIDQGIDVVLKLLSLHDPLGWGATYQAIAKGGRMTHWSAP